MTRSSEKMQLRYGILIAFLLILALSSVALSSSTTSAQGTATIHPSPAPLEVGVGLVGNLDIVIENVQDLYGVDLRAHFDPSVVQVVDADPSASGIQLVPGSFVQPDYVLYNTADNALGTLEYILTETNPTLPVSGTGTLVTIKFRGVVLTQNSPFVIDYVQFSDRFGQTIAVTPENGLINVVVPKFIYYFPVIGRAH